jgi:hypothetical protein
MTKLEKLKAVLDTTNAAYANAVPDCPAGIDTVNAAYDAWDSARDAYLVELKKQQEKTNGV